MANAFDSFEKEAFHESGIPWQERSVLKKTTRGVDQLKIVDAYMTNNIERQSEECKNDPRARKLRGDATSRQAAREQEFHDSVDPGAWAKDFGMGDGHTMNSLDESEQDQEEQRDDRRQDEDESEEPDKEEGESDDGSGDNPDEEESPEEGAEETPEGEGAGEGAADAAEGVGEAGEVAEGAGAAGEGAAAAEASAAAAETAAVATEAAAVAEAAAAAETAAAAAAAGAAAPELLIIVAVIVAVLLIVGLLIAVFWGQKGDLNNSTGGTPSVICIDPGHKSEVGSGTSAPDGTTELHMNWVVAKELETALKSKGYSVVLTKASESQYVTNVDRVDKCAAAGAAFDYRIHMDSPGGIAGPWHEVPGPGYSNVHDTSKKYADAIQASIAEELGITGHTSGSQPINGGVRNDTKELEGSKEANKKKIPVALIEMMTMDNVNVTWIKNDANRAKLVKGMANGIAGAIPVSSGGGSGDSAAVIAKAKTQLGVPYSLPGACRPWTTGTKESGCATFDCSSFVAWAWYWGSNKKVTLEGTTAGMYGSGSGTSKYTLINNYKDMQIGDVVVHHASGGSLYGHTRLYEGNGKFIEATGTHVQENKYSDAQLRAGGYIYLRPVVK